MRFTFTTSFYNNCEYVQGLYNAIKAQTYKNWEWVVTDDFSTHSSSKELLKDIAKNDRKVKYVDQYFKKEMFWNPQNFCKDAEIIIQMDSDDWPVPKALEVYHYFFTKFPDVVLMICASHHINAQNKRWAWYDFLDNRLFNNLSCGHITFFRAWRNNPNINYDFNPKNQMKHYFNDLSLVCSLEEYGKVLSLPRDLYRRNNRHDSISCSLTPTGSVRDEGINLENNIKKRRLNPQFDSFNRYFDPILDFKYCFSDISFGEISQQLKISFHSKCLNFQRENLLKELYFDHHIIFNKIDGDEDYVFINVTSIDDIKNFIHIAKNFNIKNLACVINYSFFDPEDLFSERKTIYDLDAKPIPKGLKFKKRDFIGLSHQEISDLLCKNELACHFMCHGHYDFYRILK